MSRAGIWNNNRPGAGDPRRAFTLVEMIVVIIVLGLCAATVFPKVPGFLLREPEPRRSARRLLRTAQYAQQLAIAAECALVLRIDGESGVYRVESKDGRGESAAVASSDLQGQLCEGVSIASEHPSADGRVETALAIEFRPEGWCDPAVLKLAASDGRTATIVIPEWMGGMELLDEGRTE